jgi:hypothetical protein
MRSPAALLLSLSGFAAGSMLVACFDLFHATDELRTACEIDAAASGGCLCAASHADARRLAEHACGWLGACETPMGDNAVGTCMVAALLAFDCEANPNHQVKGAQADTWACLAAASTCGDVEACLFPEGPPQCATRGDYTACAPSSRSAPRIGDVRVECSEGGSSSPSPAHGESCALWGKTCSQSEDPATAGVCAPSTAKDCTVDQCADGGTRIDWCANGTNVGIDCAGWGNRACGGFPRNDPAWIACLPESDAVGACTPTLDAGCSGGVALSCPTGAPERLDCAALLGSGGGQACHPGVLDPPFDWMRPCRIDPPACAGDACDRGAAIGCALGAPFSVDCASAGLGACAMRSTDLGTNLRAACTPPPR